MFSRFARSRSACAAALSFGTFSAAISDGTHPGVMCAPSTTEKVADLEARLVTLEAMFSERKNTKKVTGPLVVQPFSAPLNDIVWEVPGSKSITNRALILAALRPGTTHLSGMHTLIALPTCKRTTCAPKGVLHSDDTRHMRNALTAMGIEIEDTGPTSLRVNGGLNKLRTPTEPIFIGNSGTSVRFLAAFAALVPGEVTLVGYAVRS